MTQATRTKPGGRPSSSGPTRTRAGRRSGATTIRAENGRGARTGSTSSQAAPRPSRPLRLPGGFGLTRRALALIVVVLMLGLSYANSVRVYLSQQAEMAELRLEHAERAQTIDNLNYELTRWQDEDYVRAMARERLGWVVPGEVGFRVVDADGEPIGASIDNHVRTPADEVEVEPLWWEKVAGTIDAADHPVVPEVVEEPDLADQPPMTADGEAPVPLPGEPG